MSAHHMVPDLKHSFTWCNQPTVFFEAIDACGGWPLGFKYVGFEHTDERAAGFTNSPQNSGWWTVVCSSDDYYLWKISPEALQRVVDAAFAVVKLPRCDVTKLWIRDSNGGRAAIAMKGGAT